MRIGLFFGSFNPIHQGHLILSQFILDQIKLDEIWFVVSPQNPLKSPIDLYDEKDRLKMVKLAIKDQPKFKACDIEFDMPRPSYTCDTLSCTGLKSTQKMSLRFNIWALTTCSISTSGRSMSKSC